MARHTRQRHGQNTKKTPGQVQKSRTHAQKEHNKFVADQLKRAGALYESLQTALKDRLEGEFNIKVSPDAKVLTERTLQAFSRAYRKDSRHKNTANALASISIDVLAENRDVLKSLNHAYSHSLTRNPRATSQNNSGRCWMFAALNTMRHRVISTLNLNDSFELSEAFLFFYDKLERANVFLEKMIEFSDRAPTDPLVCAHMSRPIEDGGSWVYLANLIKKYGIVPKTCYGENWNTSYTEDMNSIIQTKLAEFARDIRASKGVSIETLRKKVISTQMPQIYAMLAQFMGEPPTTFTWTYHEAGETYESLRDRGAYHTVSDLTPGVFFRDYVDVYYRIDRKVLLRHDPRKTSKYYECYTTEHMGGMIGGLTDVAFNVPLDVFKAAAIASIKADEGVWFSCDVGKEMNQERALLSTEAFDYEGLLHTRLGISKADGLDTYLSYPTHAMALVAVDLAEDQVTAKKWRVENSWGECLGEEDPGYLQMSDAWFDKYVFDIVVDINHLPEEAQDIYAKTMYRPIVLPYNDPFGNVAEALRH